MRAISILTVVLCHLNIQFNLFPALNDYPVIADGQFGVNVFFVISGFLITSLLLREEDKTGTISLKKFYARRTLRIFPAYYFLLFIYFLLTLFHYVTISASSWLTAITYTKYFNWQQDWITAHAWSLSIEEHFYLFWPLIFLTGKRIRVFFLVFIIIAIPLFKVYIYKTHHPINWANDLTIFMRLDAIATGCICALYREKILKVFSLNWKIVFYTSVAVLLILPKLTYLNLPYIPYLHLNLILIPFRTSYGTVANIAIASIMLFSVFGPAGPWFKFLNSKIMNQIGIWSYSIYIWQQFFINKTGLWINKLPLNILLLFICALFSYYIIEKPFLKLKSKFST